MVVSLGKAFNKYCRRFSGPLTAFVQSSFFSIESSSMMFLKQVYMFLIYSEKLTQVLIVQKKEHDKSFLKNCRYVCMYVCACICVWVLRVNMNCVSVMERVYN